jgi:hypothetical protein
MDARILALILLVAALFSFNIAVLGFDRMPNLLSLPSLELSRLGDTTPNGILVIGTLILTSASLVLLASAYWLIRLRRPPRLYADQELARNVAQERWLTAARATYLLNEAAITRRHASVVRALHLLASQCLLVVYLAVMDVLERGTAPVVGAPEWLVSGLGCIAAFGCVLLLTLRTRIPVED